MIRTTLLSILTAGVSISGLAQQNFVMLEYPVGFPQGNLKEYIEKNCWRGLGFGYRYLADDNFAVGIDLSDNLFYERKDQATYTWETTSITGVQYRYENIFNVSAQADYVLGYGEDFRPFLGIGAGAMYVTRDTDFGVYRFHQDAWQFLLQPEVGFSYYLSD